MLVHGNSLHQKYRDVKSDKISQYSIYIYSFLYSSKSQL